MPLPTQTLDALQAAGAAIYQADLELKAAAQDYGSQVKAAMTSNPFELGNDVLFEEWKTVARLSQAVAQIETEFRKIYEAASGLTASDKPNLVIPTLFAPLPVVSAAPELAKESQATDAVIKRQKPAKAKQPAKGTAPKPLTGNTAKLFAYLVEVLSPNEFGKIDRQAVIVKAGIARGSVGAAIAKLLETGHLIANASGAHKLSHPASPKK